MPASETNIHFQNDLVYNEEVNVYTFRNFYNGAGVAIGDFNNDNLADIFFCGNQVDNKLYLNRGDFKFEDVTDEAQVASKNVWSTGISIVDINADGWLDYYVSKSGDINGENRHNELFINQGVSKTVEGLDIVSFKEESKKYGLDDIGLSTHAAFFDYDLDGDLDCYLLNNSFKSVGNYDLRKDQRSIRDEEGGNKLFRNNTIEGIKSGRPVFEDVSEAAGIYGSAIGFGLGVSIGDLNQDGWPDIFVSNDFFEKDYLYINNKDGSFTEQVEQSIGELSMGSMGADMADINNDGLAEIFVTEMLPRAEVRSKSKAQFQNWNTYQANIENGYHKQFARNVLQLNIGSGQFSEIGRMAGVEATDWSWGALMFDMDNDGLKDIFVANGIYKDLLDQDYINFYSNPAEVRKILFDKEHGGIDKLIDKIPSEAISNVTFRNKGDLTFEDIGSEWGLDLVSFSNGSAYGDLDNDGDLDLVVNNINMAPMIYRNNLENPSFLQLDLSDQNSKNRKAYGAKVYLYQNDNIQYQEFFPAKGFMSSVQARIHFGLQDNRKIDSLLIKWPDQTKSVIRDLAIDTILRIEKSKIDKAPHTADSNEDTKYLMPENISLDYTHNENLYSDFDKEPLLPSMHSNLGPACCRGDINNDGLTDFYIGGSNGQSGKLFVQSKNSLFRSISVDVFQKHINSEDVSCQFFDANGDGFSDLYVASGSSEYGPNNVSLADRLYFNNSGKNFSYSNQILPSFKFENTSDVVALDFDGDGDQDLCVSIFIKPYVYGIPESIYLLENDGKGNFKNVTKQKAPSFQNLGMISALAAGDVDNDGDTDIVAVGEWMGVEIFKNRDGGFEREETELQSIHGMWTNVALNDLDDDGKLDILLSNHGVNSRLKASEQFPLKMYINDFDKNGKAEQILCYNNEAGEYGYHQRNDLLKQLPILNKQFPDFSSFAGKRVQEIFPGGILDSGIVLKIVELRSGIAWNNSNSNYEFSALPENAQLSTMYTSYISDINNDGIKDILLGGNQYRSKPELGIHDGSYSALLLGKGSRIFKFVAPNEGGVLIKGEIRKIIGIGTKEKERILIARNNDSPIILKN